jgi:hypothetical protein
MTRRLLAIPLLAAMLAACSDLSPLASTGPSRNTTSSSFVVSGNTVGPMGQIWQVTGSDALCETHVWYVTVVSGPTAATTDVICHTSQMGTWNAETYNGGQISITANYQGQIGDLGAVNADMSDEARTFDLPAGTNVTLEAYPNQGCQFYRWRVGGSYQYTNPVTVSVDNAGQAQGWFTCS